MACLSGQKLGLAICHAFGVDPMRVRGVTLRCEVGHVAEMDVTYMVRVEGLDEFVEDLKTYRLVEDAPADSQGGAT